jgi:uncharacterized protein DUF3568
MGRAALAAWLAVAVLSAPGCAAPIALTLLGSSAGIAAGTGTQYTLDGIAYRTFTAPLEDVRRATVITMRRMDVKLSTDEATTDGRSLVAQAGDRTVYIELEKLTSRTTRMRITAKHGWFWRDRATAGEVIAQTERSLDDLPALTQKTR